MRRFLAIALSTVMAAGALVSITATSGEAATVKRGGKCSAAVTASVRGTQYSCKTGTWQPVAATVKVNRGCTYKGELARTGSTLVSCVQKGRSLTWVKANKDCNSANTLLNKTNATYNQSMAQVRRIEAQVKNMTGPDAEKITAQLATIKTNLATVQTLIKDSRATVIGACSKA